MKKVFGIAAMLLALAACNKIETEIQTTDQAEGITITATLAPKTAVSKAVSDQTTYIEAEWAEKYLPSLKWELIESKLEAIQPVEPTSNQIVDHIKDILRRNDQKPEGETKEQTEDRLEKAARSIAADRQNVDQLVNRLYAENLAKLFKAQLKPEVEKVSAKEFAERAKK